MDRSIGSTPKTLGGEPRAAAGSVLSGDARLRDIRGLRRRRVARREYRPATRLEFLDECLEKARFLLPAVTTPRELLQVALAAAILIDRRRVEEGKVTDRLEVRDSESRDRLARIMARLMSPPRRLNGTSQSH